ncbi:MAG: hypothetical protein H6965_05295 [Chromatiaceae bacterium]|nr:hypothetical protein [Chromatiaceae bacterium]
MTRPTEEIIESILTCPDCGSTRKGAMPEDHCVWYWRCPGCGVLLRP